MTTSDYKNGLHFKNWDGNFRLKIKKVT